MFYFSRVSSYTLNNRTTPCCQCCWGCPPGVSWRSPATHWTTELLHVVSVVEVAPQGSPGGLQLRTEQQNYSMLSMLLRLPTRSLQLHTEQQNYSMLSVLFRLSPRGLQLHTEQQNYSMLSVLLVLSPRSLLVVSSYTLNNRTTPCCQCCWGCPPGVSWWSPATHWATELLHVVSGVSIVAQDPPRGLQVIQGQPGQVVAGPQQAFVVRYVRSSLRLQKQTVAVLTGRFK